MTLPCIYPSEKDWKEGITFTILGQGKHHLLAIWEPLSFNFLKGISEKGEYTLKYFIIEHQVGEFRQSLQELRLLTKTPPVFPLPQFGVSQKLLQEGLSEEEACQVAAIFRVETEACLLEIWVKLCPTMSDKCSDREWTL